MSANNQQVGGTHYAAKVQHWDYVNGALRGRYFEGNITKYVARHRKKNGLQDLEKAKHYLSKLEELHASGLIKAPRELGDVGDGHVGPAFTTMFIEAAGLNYWEGRLMVMASIWATPMQLREVSNVIDILVMQYKDEHGEEPGRSYVDPDQTSKRLDVQTGLTPVMRFAAWLTTRPGTLVIGDEHDASRVCELVQEFDLLEANLNGG